MNSFLPGKKGGCERPWGLRLSIKVFLSYVGKSREFVAFLLPLKYRDKCQVNILALVCMTISDNESTHVGYSNCKGRQLPVCGMCIHNLNVRWYSKAHKNNLKAVFLLYLYSVYLSSSM